jgi:hypothetical protein
MEYFDMTQEVSGMATADLLAARTRLQSSFSPEQAYSFLQEEYIDKATILAMLIREEIDARLIDAERMFAILSKPCAPGQIPPSRPATPPCPNFICFFHGSPSSEEPSGICFLCKADSI